MNKLPQEEGVIYPGLFIPPSHEDRNASTSMGAIVISISKMESDRGGAFVRYNVYCLKRNDVRDFSYIYLKKLLRARRKENEI